MDFNRRSLRFIFYPKISFLSNDAKRSEDTEDTTGNTKFLNTENIHVVPVVVIFIP